MIVLKETNSVSTVQNEIVVKVLNSRKGRGSLSMLHLRRWSTKGVGGKGF